VANLNKVMLIGRLTRDPEMRTFSNGGKVAKFGFAVNNRKKNQQSGQWEDEPVFLDVEAFNRGENGRQADLVEQYLAKGRQVFIEGHLKLDSWTAQDGQKRNRLLVVVDNFQFLEPRQDGDGSGGNGASRAPRGTTSAAPRQQAPPAYTGGGGNEYGDEPEPSEPSREEDIPF
jgi:single-strand DNA-binding protein